SFSQDDAHVFCTEEQIEAEVLRAVSIIFEIYRTFDFSAVAIGIGTRPEKRIGDDAQWDAAEGALARALERHGLAFTLSAGHGGCSEPKVASLVKDACARESQPGTVQLNFQLPRRCELTYIAADGAERAPVMIHPAMLVSVERFLGILLEHTGGALPPWLA